MNIKNAANITGFSAHSLRYYEKIGLLNNIDRKANGQRDYSQKDIDWLVFIAKLKKANMPLRQIKEYAKMRAQGIKTHQQRKLLLIAHKKELDKRIEELMECQQSLTDKIAWYEQQKI